MRPSRTADDGSVMRRRAIALSMGAFLLGSSAAASPAEIQPWSRESPEYWVGQAVLAAGFYQQDHKSYKGMTVAKLRRMNTALRNVRVVRASKKTYCIEGRLNGLTALRNGPAVLIRRGTCAAPAAAKPVPGRDIPQPEVTAALRNIRAASPALAAFAEDNNGYARLTLAALQKWDAKVKDITVAWAERATFCIESAALDGSTAHWEFGEFIDAGLCPRSR